MKKLIVLLASVLVVLLGTPATAQQNDRDCDDFAFQEDAQSFFDDEGPGDPHRLDADGDGVACEDLPSREADEDDPDNDDTDDTDAAPTSEPTPTLDPDDIAMELPGLPPLPDPATLESTAAARPRTPRSARGSDDRDVLPAVAREDDRRTLPKNGAQTRTYGTTGVVLVGAGIALLALASIATRRRRHAMAVAVGSPPTSVAAASDDPPWGPDSLIGW